MKAFVDKVVAITGAGSGIGRCVALEIARHKGIVFLLDVNEQGLKETAQMVSAQGGKAEWQLLDIRKEDQWKIAADKIIATFGHVDVLINNAGVFSLSEDFMVTDIERARFIFDVNVFGTFIGCRTFAPLLAKRPEALLVNVTSSLALVPVPLYSMYCASKGAATNLTNVIREELSQTSVRVVTVFPGPTKTNLGRNIQSADKKAIEEHASHFERFAPNLPEDAARAIVKGLLSGKKQVCTSTDSKISMILSRLAPMFGNSLLGKAMRKGSNPNLFAKLDALR